MIVQKRGKGALQVGLVVAFAALLWLIFPWVARFVGGAALSIRRFWWLVLLLALSVWSAWVLRKRNPL